jgi:NAD(P)-dependent dehydrogenase (short-subunit alcohol dehydrogenase family)
MNCNLKASYFLMKKYAEGMKARGFGRIVTLGSCNQYNQHPELSLYAATKAAQYKMVKNFAPALAPFGVTVNNVAPGAIATPRNAEIVEDDARRAAVEEKIPCGRFGTPEDIAPAVLLLCSDEGAYITGSEIVIDGGLSLK